MASPYFTNQHLNSKKTNAFTLEGVKRLSNALVFVSFVDALHHPQSKYVTELYHIYAHNVCIVFGDNGCGSVDCVNEASSKEDLPTIVLDSRSGVGLSCCFHFLGIVVFFHLQLSFHSSPDVSLLPDALQNCLPQQVGGLCPALHSLPSGRGIGRLVRFGSLPIPCQRATRRSAISLPLLHSDLESALSHYRLRSRHSASVQTQRSAPLRNVRHHHQPRPAVRLRGGRRAHSSTLRACHVLV